MEVKNVPQKTIVIFIHGFMGSSRIFDDLARSVKEKGFDVDLVTLAGHDDTIFKFFKTPSRMWTSSVDEYLDKMRTQYDNIILVTHSMGGLISINHLVDNCDKVRHIIAIALPVNIQPRMRLVKSCLLYTFKKGSDADDKYVAAMRKQAGIGGIKFYNSPLLIPKTIAFFRLSNLTKIKINKLTVPITVINSEDDELVSRRSFWHIKRIKENLNLIELKNSGHFWFEETEYNIVKDAVLSILKEHTVDPQTKVC
ncbi:MAG: alpha/beta fold hydrolase [Defluviitaleaceae bacterium]|nr:alpha/beta fold hydrolase [Defluviitaleaceae bacterium]